MLCVAYVGLKPLVNIDKKAPCILVLNVSKTYGYNESLEQSIIYSSIVKNIVIPTL